MAPQRSTHTHTIQAYCAQVTKSYSASNLPLYLSEREPVPVIQRTSALGRLQEREMQIQKLWMVLKISYLYLEEH